MRQRQNKLSENNNVMMLWRGGCEVTNMSFETMQCDNNPTTLFQSYGVCVLGEIVYFTVSDHMFYFRISEMMIFHGF